MGRVLGLGTAALDYRILTADLGVGYTEKLLAREVSIFGGGAMGNCLVQTARLGTETIWLGKLGEDWIGRTIIGQLEAEGIDCSQVLYDPLVSSPFNLAVYSGSQRRRVGGYLLPNSLAHLSQSDLTTLVDTVQAEDWIVAEIGEISLEMVLLFCRMAKDRGAFLAVDVDLDPVTQCGAQESQLIDILGIQDLIMANEKAMTTVFPNHDASDLAGHLSERFSARTVVTAGQGGCYAAVPGAAVTHLPSLAVHVVDSVGAGDAFHGGLLYALARGRSWEEALHVARKCAALNCTAFGARVGMPTLQALEESGGDRY